MDNQHQNNTVSDMQSSNASSGEVFSVDRLENNGNYWNDLMVDALGTDPHPITNIENEIGQNRSEHQILAL